MNEQQFLDLLEAKLMKLQQKERADIRRDLEEYFENGRNEGKTTEDIITALGDMDELAEELMAAYDEVDLTDAISLAETDSVLPYRNVKVDVGNVNLSIVSTDAQYALIEVKDEDELTDATMVIENDTLVVRAHRREKSFRFLFIYVKGSISRANVILHLPKKQFEKLEVKNDDGAIALTNLHATSFNLISDNGRIVLDQLSGQKITAESDNGRIILSNIVAQDVKVFTDNGRIIAEQVKTAELELETDNGRIEMKNVIGKISAQSDNGRIVAELEHVHSPIVFKTSNGAILLTTEGKLENVSISANTSYGSASIYEEKTSKYENGTMPIPVKLKTSNGRIVVTDSKAVAV